MSAAICGTGSRCDRHDLELHGYPCYGCHQEWARRSPRVVALVSRSITKAVTPAQMNKARAADAQAYRTYEGPHRITVERAGPSGPVSRLWNALCLEECGWSHFWAKSPRAARAAGAAHTQTPGNT